MKNSKTFVHPTAQSDPYVWVPPPGLRTEGSRATEIIPPPEDVGAFALRMSMRMMSVADFVATRGSGTLRKTGMLGMSIASFSMEERVAYEFGWGFETCAERFITWGEARSEGDCKPITEAAWHIERYASIALFPGDEMECKYIRACNRDHERQGIGIVIRKTSVQWLPKGYVVFCIVTEYDVERDHFLPAINPC